VAERLWVGETDDDEGQRRQWIVHKVQRIES